MKFFLTILLIFISLFSFTQKKWRVTVVNKHNTYKTITFNDTIKIKPYLKSFQYKLLKKGWALAQFDSLVWNKKRDSLRAFLYKGVRFDHLVIDFEEKDKSIIRKAPKIAERLLAKVPFKSEDIIEVYESILNYLENNGYPFARVRLNHLQLSPTSPHAKLEIDRGPELFWDEIFIKGKAKISPNFIKTYIGIREEKSYSEKTFRAISKKISQLNYLALTQAPQVIFTKKGADLYLFLESPRISSANGILGIQPNDEGKVTFTGDVKLNLVNLLKHGEKIALNWKSLRPKTQQVDVAVKAPFLFKTNFGVEGNFHLYKRDSSFLEIKALGGIQYYLNGGNYLRGFYRFESSHILSGAKNTTEFSTGESIKTNFYGIGLIRNQVDYIPNPTSGLQLDVEASVGLRKAFPTDSVGQKRTVKSTSSKIKTSINYFIPLGKRHTIRLGNKTSAFYADTIYSNEQLRFGGLNTQRGFNKQSLYATFYTTFTIEYRFLLDKNSNIFAFYDQSWYENNSGTYYNDAPLGFGLGVSFGTKVGTFSFSYALGRQFGNPISFKDGKIHFGYIAYF